MAPLVFTTIAGYTGLCGFATGDHITAQVVREGEGNWAALFHCNGVKLGEEEMTPTGFTEEVVLPVSFGFAGGAAKNVRVVYDALASSMQPGDKDWTKGQQGIGCSDLNSLCTKNRVKGKRSLSYANKQRKGRSAKRQSKDVR